MNCNSKCRNKCKPLYETNEEEKIITLDTINIVENTQDLSDDQFYNITIFYQLFVNQLYINNINNNINFTSQFPFNFNTPLLNVYGDVCVATDKVLQVPTINGKNNQLILDNGTNNINVNSSLCIATGKVLQVPKISGKNNQLILDNGTNNININSNIIFDKIIQLSTNNIEYYTTQSNLTITFPNKRLYIIKTENIITITLPTPIYSSTNEGIFITFKNLITDTNAVINFTGFIDGTTQLNHNDVLNCISINNGENIGWIKI